jgi:hypothetical protein
MIFQEFHFLSRGRGYTSNFREAASILTNINILYTETTNCCKIHRHQARRLQ